MCFKLVMLLKKGGGFVCVAQGAGLSQVFVPKRFFSNTKRACLCPQSRSHSEDPQHQQLKQRAKEVCQSDSHPEQRSSVVSAPTKWFTKL